MTEDGRDHDPLGADVASDLSYSVRAQSNRRIWASRILGTGSLFGTGMGLALLLGRRRT